LRQIACYFEIHHDRRMVGHVQNKLVNDHILAKGVDSSREEDMVDGQRRKVLFRRTHCAVVLAVRATRCQPTGFLFDKNQTIDTLRGSGCQRTNSLLA